MKRASLILMTIVLLGCGSNDKEQSIVKEHQNTIDASAAVSNWQYYDAIFPSAKCTSPTKFNFKTPFDEKDGSTISLCLLAKESGNSVSFAVSKGLFVETDLRISFDEKEFKSYKTEVGSKGDIIFLHEPKILNEIKAAKKLIVEVVFWGEPAREIEFNIEGLKWDY